MNQAAVKIDTRKSPHSDTIVVIVQTPAVTPIVISGIEKSIDSLNQRLKGTLAVKVEDQEYYSDKIIPIISALCGALCGALLTYHLQKRLTIDTKRETLRKYIHKHKSLLESKSMNDAQLVKSLLNSEYHWGAYFDAIFLNRDIETLFKNFEQSLKGYTDLLQSPAEENQNDRNDGLERDLLAGFDQDAWERNSEKLRNDALVALKTLEDLLIKKSRFFSFKKS